MWLRNGDRIVLVPDSMPDTITRCLKDGWVETADPRAQADAAPVLEAQPPTPDPAPIEPEPIEPEPATEPASGPTPEPEPASEPARKAGR